MLDAQMRIFCFTARLVFPVKTRLYSILKLRFLNMYRSLLLFAVANSFLTGLITTIVPSYVQVPNFILQFCWSNGKCVTIISQ